MKYIKKVFNEGYIEYAKEFFDKLNLTEPLFQFFESAKFVKDYLETITISDRSIYNVSKWESILLTHLDKMDGIMAEIPTDDAKYGLEIVSLCLDLEQEFIEIAKGFTNKRLLNYGFFLSYVKHISQYISEEGFSMEISKCPALRIVRFMGEGVSQHLKSFSSGTDYEFILKTFEDKKMVDMLRYFDWMTEAFSQIPNIVYDFEQAIELYKQTADTLVDIFATLKQTVIDNKKMEQNHKDNIISFAQENIVKLGFLTETVKFKEIV